MGYRMSAGVDLFHKQNIKSNYAVYDSYSTGATIRAGIPITDEFSVGLRYSLYQTRIKIPNDSKRPYNDCTTEIPGVTPGSTGWTPPTGAVGPFPNEQFNCVTNGEASLAIKEAEGARLTSAIGTTFSYNTLDNGRNPTSGLYAELRADLAGLGGDSKWLRTTGDVRYYYPVWEDVTAMARVQGGQLFALGGEKLRVIDNFNLGPSLVRGFAPSGIGPRDKSVLDNRTAGLGGTTYFGGSLELQFPIWGLPREIGLRGALFADAGTLFGYKGRENFSDLIGLPANTNCYFYGAGSNWKQSNCIDLDDDKKIRSSVGASILWQSPLGPIRFDYAFVLSKADRDVTQAFRFSGGTSF
jgi:outer membrane protein insertion porin family